MELLDRILRQNPWWEKKKIEAIESLKERELFKNIYSNITNKQIISVIGLRRVGKTILLFQIINKLLKKVDPKRIMYFSFDEIIGKDPNIIERVLTIYEEEILKEELKDVFIFFDEINHIKEWQVIIKRYYDLEKKIKFFCSGSSSLFLKKAKESLAGRIYEFNLNPLSFKEYLSLKGINIDNIAINSLTIRRELNNYLVFGSFPELINEKDFKVLKKYVTSIIEKIIFYDIPKIYDVREPELLKELLSLIAKNPGMLLDYQKLASSLNLSYQTVSKYIRYMKNAFLIKLLYNFRGSPIASARKLKKAYPSTQSLIASFVDSESEFFSLMPKIVEGLVVQFLEAKFFWRKYYEIDIYYKKKVIEVKYREKPDIKNTIDAAKNLKSKELIIVTKNLYKKQTIDNIKVNYIPLWKFLLLKKDTIGL